MLPVLEAREAIRGANQMAFAFGGMTKEAADAYRFQLNRTATLDDEDAPRLAVRPTTPAMLAALSGGTTKVIMQPGPQTSTTKAA